MLYKPQSQYMFPNNIVLNNQEDNNFSVIISGVKISNYILNMKYLQSGVSNPSWVEFYNVDNAITTLSSPLYNGDELSIEISSDTIGSISSGVYLNRQLGWQISLLGDSVQGTPSGVSPQMTITNHNFKTGEQVWISSGTAKGIAYVAVIDSNTCWFSTKRERVLVYDSATDSIDSSYLNAVPIYPMSQSDVIVFMTINKGTFTLLPDTTNYSYYDAIPTYSQVNNIALSNYVAYLYDENENLISTTDTIYSSNVQHRYEGLLSGQVYGIRIIANDINMLEYDTGIVQLSCIYSIPTIDMAPIATNNCQESCVDLSWGNIIQLIGSVDGDYSFVDSDVMGIKLLNLDANSVLTFTPIEKLSTGSIATFIIKFISASFDGDICKYTNSVSGKSYTINYENSTGILSHTVDGVRYLDQVFSSGLDTNKTYLVATTEFHVRMEEIIVNY